MTEYNFTTVFNQLTNISLIRAEKILEMTQSSILYFIIGLFFGIILEKIFPTDDANTVKNRTTQQLIGLIFLQLCAITIVVFYINKILPLVPFIFYIPPYVPGLKGRNKMGGTIILTLILYRTQMSFVNRVAELIIRLS